MYEIIPIFKKMKLVTDCKNTKFCSIKNNGRKSHDKIAKARSRVTSFNSSSHLSWSQPYKIKFWLKKYKSTSSFPDGVLSQNRS